MNPERFLDATLREGEQTPKIYFKPEEKCQIAEMLCEILGPKGFVEIGQPYSSEYGDRVESVGKHFKERFDDAKLLDNCRTSENDVDIVHECGLWGVVVLLVPSENHLLHKLNKMPYEKALKRTAEVIFKETNDEFTSRVSSRPEEIKALLEVRFEYVCEKDCLVFFQGGKLKSYIKTGKSF